MQFVHTSSLFDSWLLSYAPPFSPPSLPSRTPTSLRPPSFFSASSFHALHFLQSRKNIAHSLSFSSSLFLQKIHIHPFHPPIKTIENLPAHTQDLAASKPNPQNSRTPSKITQPSQPPPDNQKAQPPRRLANHFIKIFKYKKSVTEWGIYSVCRGESEIDVSRRRKTDDGSSENFRLTYLPPSVFRLPKKCFTDSPSSFSCHSACLSVHRRPVDKLMTRMFVLLSR